MGKGYDKDLDKVLKEWRHKISSERELSLTIRCYNNGTPKLQIGPYIRVDSEGNDIGVWGKLGRLDIQEIKIISQYLQKVLKFLERTNK